MIKPIINILLLCIISIRVCRGQNITSDRFAKIPNDGLPRTLVDKKSSRKFILDSSHISIEAIDKNGTRLWKSDPWKDAKLKVYRVERPKIITFYLLNDQSTGFKGVIAITFNNSQSGDLDELTGKFKYLGQD